MNDPKTLDGDVKIEQVWCVLFGPPGIGKTTLTATLTNPIFLCTDWDGILSIRDSGHKYFTIDTWKDWENSMLWMKKHKDEFGPIVIDTVTELQDLFSDQLVPASELSLTQQFWGQSYRKMREVFKQLRDNFHGHDVIFIADERERMMVGMKEPVIVPNMSPAPLKLLNRRCRLVMRMYGVVKRSAKGTNVERRLQVNTDGKVWCKDTSGTLPSRIADPDLNLVLTTVKSITKQSED